MTVLGVDISNHQAEPDWPLLARSVGFIALKATEGVGFVDRTWASRRRSAHAAGIPAVGAYHFARLGNVAAEAAAFLAALGPLAPTEFTALDLEVAVAGVDPVAWSAAWLDAVHAKTGRWPLIYLNGSELAGLNWAPVAARGVRLWLAKYDGSQAPVGAGQFPALTVKQFTDVGTVPGVAATVDVDVLYGSPTDLTASQEADMNLTDLIESRIPSDIGPDGKGRMVPLSALLQNTQYNAEQALEVARQALAAAQAAATAVQAVAQAVSAVPAQTARALPAMACQGNPKAVLGALGQAASAAAAQ